MSAGHAVHKAALAYALWCVAISGVVATPGTAVAQAPMRGSSHEAQVSSRLNPTGKTIYMPLPLMDDDQSLGEITVQIDSNDTLSLSRAELVRLLAPKLEPKARARLEALSPEATFVLLDALRLAGFQLNFDHSRQEIQLKANREELAANDISMAGRRPAPAQAAKYDSPALISGYVNLIGGLDQRWGTSDSDPTRTSGRLEIDQALRLGGVVLENKALVEGAVDANVCPLGAACVYDHKQGFKRQSSRLVYDFPEQSLRLGLGDVDYIGAPQQRSLDQLGVSLSKSDRRFRPGESVQPTGRASFSLDRNSTVDVLVNGLVMQQLRLRAGTYNIRDLPLSTGSNEVELVITDDLGQTRRLSFNSFFDGTMLAEGRDEWSASSGVLSYLRDNERYYDGSNIVTSGVYRRGLTDFVTGEAHGQGDEHGGMGGLAALMRTTWGILRIQAAGSSSRFGMGGAFGGAWEVTNFKGIAGKKGDSFRLEAEYRTDSFYVPGTQLITATGILYPHQEYRMRVIGSYTTQLDHNISASLSARYTTANESSRFTSPWFVKSDRYGVDLTLSMPLTAELSGSITAGYSNETYLRWFQNPSKAEDAGEARIAARLYWRPDYRTSVVASHDTLTRQTTVSGISSYGSGIGRWETSVNVHNNQNDGGSSASGSIYYIGNRATVSATHITDAGGTRWDNFHPAVNGQRTLVRVGTGIAFADGQVAVGPPIRNGGFAILYPHATLGDREVVVTDGTTVRAKTDALGPAVVADIPNYYPSSIGYDVADLPVGYSLGSGAFQVNAPYKAGYALQVGSESSMTVVGTLLKADGSPISLLPGEMYPEKHPDRVIKVFTNGAGRFGGEGLAPGRWHIVMATDGEATRYVVDLPSDVGELVRLGELRPGQSGSSQSAPKAKDGWRSTNGWTPREEGAR